MSDVTLHMEGPLAIVRLNRPERMNAIGGALLDDLHDALQSALDDASCRVIVLTGAGRAFCAGDDLKEFDAQSESDESIRSHIGRIQRITHDLMFGAKPVVARCMVMPLAVASSGCSIATSWSHRTISCASFPRWSGDSS